MNQDRLTWDGSGPLEERAIGSRVRDIDGRALFKSHVVRKAVNLVLSAEGEFRVRTGQSSGRVNTAPDGRPRNSMPDSLNDPSRVRARRVGQFRQNAVLSRTNVGFDGVDADRVDSDEHLAIGNLRFGDFRQSQNFRTAHLSD
jgi:hypothetical protein